MSAALNLEEPKLEPETIQAIQIRGNFHRVLIDDHFRLAVRVDIFDERDGDKPYEFVRVSYLDDEGEWKGREYGHNEDVTVLPRVLFKIPMHKLEGLRAKFEKLNKRAERRKLTPVYFEELEEIEETLYYELTVYNGDYNKRYVTKETYEKEIAKERSLCDMRKEMRRYKMVKIVGESPHYNGWRATGVLEHLPHGTLVHTIGEHIVPEQYRESENICDHCKTKRRRKKTLIIEHENGETKQIGLNCAADFVGVKSAVTLVGDAELWQTFVNEIGSHESGGGWQYPPDEVDIEEYLAWVSLSIRQEGWSPKSNPDRFPTASDAYDLMFPSMREKPEERRERLARGRPTKHDLERAKAALDWTQSLEGVSEFEHNLKLLTSLSWFPASKKGYIAYAVQGYLKEIDQQSRREAEAKKPLSEHVGEIGERLDLEVTCTKRRFIQGEMWDSILYHFLDDEGNLFVWFASGSFAHDDWVVEERRYAIRGTVKKHDDYQGRKQTILSRVMFPDIKKAQKGGMTSVEFLGGEA